MLPYDLPADELIKRICAYRIPDSFDLIPKYSIKRLAHCYGIGSGQFGIRGPETWYFDEFERSCVPNSISVVLCSEDFDHRYLHTITVNGWNRRVLTLKY